MPTSTVRSENTRVILDHPSWQPDILVLNEDRSPVVIEAEYQPAANVENEALQRLGESVADLHRQIEAAIALQYPVEIGEEHDIRNALLNSKITYSVFTLDQGRFPTSGWLTGSVTDIADIIRLVSVPQRAVDQAVATLEHGIDAAVPILSGIRSPKPAIGEWIANLLGMPNILQTHRMACAIIANAMVFHERLAGTHPNIKSLPYISTSPTFNVKRTILDAWQNILEINYWPIFAIANDIIEQLPADEAAQLLNKLQYTAEAVASTGVNNAHDLTGRIFQRLIADRKYLATFYTLPASAALLAQLAVAKMKNVDWADAEAISQLRIADFACGTGALLSAVYEQVATRHERNGGNTAKLHPIMLEKVLYGCDVMPSAIHITGSTLSGMEPSVQFQNTRLYTLAYGRQKDNSVAIGSLELLKSSAVMTLFNTSDPAKRTGSIGEETATQINTDIPDNGFDLIIMNPPFTRSTNHEGQHRNIVNPAFAAFGATTNDQSKMGDRLNQLGKQTCYHGNAGLASAFAAIADRKLKPDGILAMVLPLSANAGVSWHNFRHMLSQKYQDVDILSIAGSGKDMSFSADTDLAECLVIARKQNKKKQQKNRIRFISLTNRPANLIHAQQVGLQIRNIDATRKIEDGPYGGTPLTIGEHITGETITTPPEMNGEVWGAVRIKDYSIAQCADALKRSMLWLPRMKEPFYLPITLLKDIGEMGFVHRDIVDPPPRGPFEKIPSSATATYPALWNHNAKNETHILCTPDSQLRVRQGMESKAHTIWQTASRTHLNLDFGLGSQPLTVAFTESPTIGGRAWPNIVFKDPRFEYPMAIWANSTLGLISFWWHANRQMPGRATTTIRSAESLPILDFRTFTNEQLNSSKRIFDKIRDNKLMPAYLADADPNRALIDQHVIRDLLGFNQNIYQAVRRISQKWCAEPSVHGAKPRPRDAHSVI